MGPGRAVLEISVLPFPGVLLRKKGMKGTARREAQVARAIRLEGVRGEGEKKKPPDKKGL